MKNKSTLFKLAVAFFFALVYQTVIAQDVQDHQKAMTLVKKNAPVIGLSNKDIANSRVSSTYEDASLGTTLVYLQQTLNGIDVDKSIKVLAFKNGTLVSSAGARIDLSRSIIFTSPSLQKKLTSPAVTVQAAIKSAAQHLHLSTPAFNFRPAGQDFTKRTDFGDLGIAKENVTARLLWVPQNTFERIKLVWEVNLSPKKTPDSWRILVDANKGDVVRKDNYTVPDNWFKKNKQPGKGNKIENSPSIVDTSGEDAQQGNTNASLQGITSVTYMVVPFPAEAPSFPNGNPTLVTNPWKLSPAGSGATPFIWNDDGNQQYRFTRGNNVLAQEDLNADNSDGKKAWGTALNNHLYFVTNPDFTKQPFTPPNQHFAITNLFYWNNIMHDLSYQYGFDEKAGNFQQNNLGRGGIGQDYVFADAQDGSGLNNANFYTPPDGYNPRMQMYLFNTKDPYLDGDLDNDIICHEYTHGISNRLTGGPNNTACLFNAEEMGEGWSDYISLMTITDWSKAQVNDGYKAKGVGTYVLNQPTNGPGTRTYPYSVDMSIDPHTYADLAAFGEVHYIGEVWTSVLWDMTWFIIQQDGINKDIFNAQGEGGNTVAYKLVMTGMKLQPCSPGFIDGRDAILKADTLLYGGKYSCLIWKAFARRGMGVTASQGSSDKTGDEMVDFTEAGIFITKHANKSTVKPGLDLTYTIGLKAQSVCGSNVKQNYSVTDSLPSNVTYVSSDGTYNSSNRTVTFKNIDMSDGDSLNYKVKVRVKLNAAFPDSVYLNDSVNSPTISNQWVAKNGKDLTWGTLNLGIYFYYSNDNTRKDAERLITAQEYFVPGNTTTFSFFHEIVSDPTNNGGVVEITSDGGNTWQDLGPYMSGFVYTNTITGNSVLNGRKAFSGYGSYGTTVINLSPFAGKKVKIRFKYATSDSSFAVPDGGTGWIIDDIVLSATPAVPNTARLYNRKDEFKGSSTVVIPIKGWKFFNNFIAVNRENTVAKLNWQTPGELDGTYKVERSVDKGVTFKEIGAVNATSDNGEVQSYDFTDASPADGINLYRIHHVSTNGTVDYTDVKALNFNNLKAVQVYPNPAKEKLNVAIPGNNKAVMLQLTDGTGKEIKRYKASGQSIKLNLPALSSGVYYLNVIKADGTISKHKVVVE